MDKIKS